MELWTPAKLNLGLRLMGVRADGYHLLESLFAPIALFDRLEIEILPGARNIELEVVISPKSGLPPALAAVTSGPDNLASRAAALYGQASGLANRIRIRLEKSIPAAAGMGGGSSDAAAVLRGLDALVDPGARLGPARLAELALELGADVPFFLDPRPSLVSGIGEILSPLEGLPSMDLVVANPGISLDTAQVYRASDALASALTQPRAGSTMRAFSRLCREFGDPRDERAPDLASGSDSVAAPSRLDTWREIWGELLTNDLEPAARRLCPPVGRLLASMRDVGAVGAGMTGSGATVFGVFESSEEAGLAADRLRRAAIPGIDSVWIAESRLIGQS